MAAIIVSVELTEITCGMCGGTYAIAERYRQKKRDEGSGWNCPYCDVEWGYFGNSRVQQLEKQLAAERAKLDQANANAQSQRRMRDIADRQAAAAMGQVTKIRNRISNGVCPHCNRHFANLHRHMQSKHSVSTPTET